MKRSGIDLTIFYYPAFLIKRILFIALPTFLSLFPYFQLQLALLVSVFFLIYYGVNKPHNQKRIFRLELFNISMEFLILYHMILFTDFNHDPTL